MFYDLRKMQTKWDIPVQYSLNDTEGKVSIINEWIGETLHFNFEGKITCTSCKKSTKKSFGQGFCYNCFRNAPEAAECIIRPELCEAHLGKGRDVEWEEKHHNQPHFVYLALSSAIKVGITRNTQIPTRWIDQGASAAIIVAETPHRTNGGGNRNDAQRFLHRQNELAKDVEKRNLNWR